MNDQTKNDEILEELSPGALRQRRFRAHNRGDHLYCLEGKCDKLDLWRAEQERIRSEAEAENVRADAAAEAVRAEWAKRLGVASGERDGSDAHGDKIVVGVPGLTVYPHGDPSEGERENAAPKIEPHSLLGILAGLPRDDGGFGSPADRKVEAFRQAIEVFDVTVPEAVHTAAAEFTLARERQSAIQNVGERGFSLADLTSDDWLNRLDEAAAARLQRQSATISPLVNAAVAAAAQRLKGAVGRALPEVVPQVEQWLEANQWNLAIYSAGGGDITPNQQAHWKGRANAVWRFAERQAEASGGGRVSDTPYAAEAWLLLWDWTPEQWAELVDLTKPGRELRPGDTFWGVASEVGAAVRFARSVRELKDRYNRLTPHRSTFYGSTPR